MFMLLASFSQLNLQLDCAELDPKPAKIDKISVEKFFLILMSVMSSHREIAMISWHSNN